MTVKDFDIINENLTGINIIEASAGTGKTFTLSLLVLRLIVENDYAINEVVAVTFTKSATAELKERIGKFIRFSIDYLDNPMTLDIPPLKNYLDNIILQKSNIDASTAKARLEKAILTIDEASVFTIHGFCQRLLTEFAFESGAKLNQELITSDDDYLNDVTNNFWRREILTLSIEEYSMLISTIKSPFDLKKYANNLIQFYSIKIDGIINIKPNITTATKKLNDIRNYLKLEWDKYKTDIQILFKEALDSGILNKTKYNSIINNNFKNIDDFLHGNSNDIKHISRLATSRIVTKKGKVISGHQFLDIVDSKIDDLELLIEKINNLKNDFIQYIISKYLNIVSQELDDIKNKKNQISFNDIIRITYNALSVKNPKRNSFINAIKTRYKVALVDEFQDTNKEQFEIFNTIFKDSIFFMIGDPKQAIYRFRGGDVYTYLEAKKIKNIKEFTLRKNFRSEKSLIDQLNKIFKSPGENPFITAGINYYEIETGSNLSPIKLNENNTDSLIVWNLPKPIGQNKDGSTIFKGDAKKIINKAIVNEIITLLNDNYTILKNENSRKVKAEDCAILVSNHSEADTLKNDLNTHGVPAVVVKPGTIYSSVEADFILTILECVENPTNISLIKGLLYQEPLFYSFDEINQNIFDIIIKFKNYYYIWQEFGISIMLKHFFEDFNIIEKLINKDFEGYRPLTNYRHLFELLNNKEIELGISPIKLISFIKTSINNEDEENEQKLESDESAVKIITIHASKGLEYPIVFVPYPWNLLNDKKRIEARSFDGEDIRFDISVNADKLKSIEEDIEEAQRKFYVALTRASQKLYLSHAELVTRKGINTNTPSHRFISKLIENGTIKTTKMNLSKSLFYRYGKDDKTNCNSIRDFKSVITDGNKTYSYSSIIKHSSDYKRYNNNSAKINTIFSFPKGARTGNAWHEIFEIIDYSKPFDSHKNNIKRILNNYGFDDTIYNFESVESMVKNTLSKKLSYHGINSFKLSDIKKTNRITEMEFYLKAKNTDIEIIKNIVRKYEAIDISVKHLKYSGYLQGFMDLVFEYSNQYFIVDWKSNHIGNSIDDYNTGKLNEAMTDNQYHLQYILYTVALTKHLMNTIKNFNYDIHIGGVYYIFLRGINENGLEGIFYHKPKKETITALINEFIIGDKND